MCIRDRVYVIETDQPNAFATGRNPENAAVAVTTGLLRILSDEEVAGVMAHELAHVQNCDTLIMTITATVAGAISMLANFVLFFGGNRNNPLGIINPLHARAIDNLFSTHPNTGNRAAALREMAGGGTARCPEIATGPARYGRSRVPPSGGQDRRRRDPWA